MTRPAISDDELLYRRIPPQQPWFEPPDRFSTANFKLDRRRNELGVSVYRAAIASAQDVLSRPEAIPHSRLAIASAGEIRSLTNALGDALQLDVIPVDDEDNPGHAEIRGPLPGKLSPAASKALQQVFRLIPE